MPPDGGAARLARIAVRLGWTALTGVAVESAVLGLAALPAVELWRWLARRPLGPEPLRVALLAAGTAPAYLVFAFCLVALSALAMRVTGWRTPAGAALAIREFPWPLLDWARYLLSAHVARALAGPVFRATPVWTWYHRWNGARLGRSVWINSLSVMDDNLLEFGDGVVVGAAVHLSGHTVERGRVLTAPVRLGAGVTVGVGSVVGIGVTIGPGTALGALSVVPKYRTLEPGTTYAGAPARRLVREPHAAFTRESRRPSHDPAERQEEPRS